MKYKTDPWQHQIDALEFGHTKTAVMWAMDMGTGKSKVAIDDITNHGFKNTLLVCPKKGMSTWRTNFEDHSLGLVEPIFIEKMTNRKKRAEFIIDMLKSKKPVVIIINYESVWKSPLKARLLLAARKGLLDCIVLDESHRIKGAGAKASRFLGTLGKWVKHRRCLTGTPMPHSPLDIYAQYRFLDPTIYGTSYQDFKMRYTVPEIWNPRVIRNFKNLDDLHEKFYRIAFRVMSDDVLDLPPTHHIVRRVELSDTGRRVYNDLEQKFVAEFEGNEITAANALVKLMRLMQVTSGAVKDESGIMRYIDREKQADLYDLLEDLPQTEGLVVFGRFSSDLKYAAEAATLSKRPYFEMSGRVDQHEDWKTAPASAVLGVQIQSGKEVVNFTKARYAYFFSTGFSLGDYQQCLKRTHRPGQTRPCTYFHAVASRTVDEKVRYALKHNEQIVESVLRQTKGAA